MPFGGLAPLPLRLGGSELDGWSPEAHARLCADLVALRCTAALARWTYTKSGATVTIHDYVGQNGAGTAYAPDSVTVNGTGSVTFAWTARAFEDSYEIEHPIRIRKARATPHGTTASHCTVDVVPNGVTVVSYGISDAAADKKITVTVW